MLFIRRHWTAIVALTILVLVVWLPVGILFVDAFAGGARWPALDSRFWTLLWQSASVAGGTATLAVGLGLPTGFLLARVELPGRAAWRALQVAPLLVPPYVSTIGWIHLAGRQSALNCWLGQWLHRNPPIVDLYTVGGAIWILGWSTFPIVSLIVISALEQISPDYEEEARLYASPWTILRCVTLPLLMPAVLGASLIVFILALGEFAVPSFLGVNVYALEVLTRFGAFFDFRSGTVAAAPLVLMVLIAFALARWLGNRWLAAGVEGSISFRRMLKVGRWSGLGAGYLGVQLAVALVLPMGALVRQAPGVQDYTLAWSAAQTQAASSLGYAILAALVAVGLGFPVAYAMVRSSGSPAAQSSEWLTLASLAIPGAVFGIGLIRLWNRGAPFMWVYQSLGIVILAMLTRALPLAVLALAHAWRHVPSVYEEFARVEGASPLQMLRWVLVPLLRPGMAAAWILAFVAAITELQTVLLVYPPGHATLAVRIYTLQHDGIAETVAALCLIFVALTLIPIGLVWRLGRNREGTP